MKNLSNFSFCIYFFTHSQELDQAFLDSLPEGMQEDIQKRVEDRGGDEEPIYRSIETQTKLEKNS